MLSPTVALHFYRRSLVSSPCERPPAKFTRSGNDFQIAGPHVRQLQLAVEILNSLPNKSGLTIQINISFFSNNFTKIVFFVPKMYKCSHLGFLDV